MSEYAASLLATYTTFQPRAVYDVKHEAFADYIYWVEWTYNFTSDLSNLVCDFHQLLFIWSFPPIILLFKFFELSAEGLDDIRKLVGPVGGHEQKRLDNRFIRVWVGHERWVARARLLVGRAQPLRSTIWAGNIRKRQTHENVLLFWGNANE